MLQKMLRAKLDAFSASLHSVCAIAIAIMLEIGRAMMNPASAGFLPASQEANVIMMDERRILSATVMIGRSLSNG